jgi:cytochrome c-type biogenesis protein CcmF
VAALWGGQKGSLLFWALVLTTFTTIVQWQNRERNRELMPYVTATLMTVTAFFLSLVVFITDPFERLAVPATEGADLNPLLQNYWMMIHPPSLYTGYVSASVPFAFAMAALATGRLGDQWIRTTRRWALFSWFFLSLGNLFGAMWAYEVLGWGGYWAWDPVENAAFMPWLVSTAYLHSVMIQEKKDMLRVWNMVLVLLTFALTIFGTFLTRSGVISSVHSFTQSGLGPFFIGFLVFAILVAWWARRLSPARAAHGRHDRVVLLARSRVPLQQPDPRRHRIRRLLGDGVSGPLGVGAGREDHRRTAVLQSRERAARHRAPLSHGRRSGDRVAARDAAEPLACVRVPVGSGLVAAIVLWVAGTPLGYAHAAFALGVFVLGTILQEFWRGMRARQALLKERAPQALARVVGKNRRRYGGYVIHVGIVMAFVGIAASSVFRIEVQQTVSAGGTFDVGRYTLRFDRIENREDGHMAASAAIVSVFVGDRQIDTLAPEKRFYKKPKQPTTEVANRSTLREDLYLVLGSYDPKTQLATILAYVNPLVVWIWLGGLVVAIGTAIAVWPGAAEQRVAVSMPDRAVAAR